MKYTVPCLALALALGSPLAAQDAPPPGAAIPGLPEEVAKIVANATQRPPETVPMSPADPLGYAGALAVLIAGDVDKACEYQFRVACALAEAGRIEEAVKHAEQIRDYRSPLALLHVASLAGNKQRTEELTASAQTWLGRSKPWQEGLIRSRLYVLGTQWKWEKEKLAAILEKIGDPEILVGARVRAQAALVLTKGASFDLKDFADSLDKVKGPVPVLVEAAQNLLKAAVGHLKTAGSDKASLALAEGLIAQALQLLKRSNAVHAEAQMEAAIDFAAAGHEDKAKQIFSGVENALGGDIEASAHLHYGMARLWKLRGKEEAVRPLIEKAEVKARGLRQMDRPYALAWISAAWRELGEPQRAESCINEASREAETNVNPRMRHLGAIEICLSYAHLKRPLEPALLESLERIRSGSVKGAPNAVSIEQRMPLSK
jgi:hypothetical protein